MAESEHPRHVTVEVLSATQTRDQAHLVPGTAAERLALVWPLTAEVCAMAGDFDAQAPLRRTAIRIIPPAI